jgi:hypothetical protein
MRYKTRSLVYLIAPGLIAISLLACDVLAFVAPAATPTATKTQPPALTPVPSDTPVPVPTNTPLPTEPTEPPTPEPTNPPPPPAGPTATLSKDEAILVYYINKNEK